MDLEIGGGRAAEQVSGAGSPWVLRDVSYLLFQIRDYAVITLGLSGEILTWNQGAVTVKGYAAEEALGRDFRMFYTEPDREGGLPERLLEQASAEGVAHSVGWRRRQDGSLFWADVTISSLREPDGTLAGFLKITRDLSAQKALEVSRARDASAFSHDLRLPLTSAVGYVELAREELGLLGDHPAGRRAEVDPERQRAVVGELLERTAESLRRLDEMMERQLDLFRADGRPRLLLSTVHLDHVLDTALATSIAAKDRPRIVVEPTGVQREVVMDVDLFARAVVNVVNNALAYSTEPVTVTSLLAPAAQAPGNERRAGDDAGDVVVVSVLDRGRGIHPDDLAVIFEAGERGRFAQVDGGSGLGLTSVRSLMARQGGWVEIASEPGRGTTVHLVLPVDGPAS